jgi:hypothetical protein
VGRARRLCPTLHVARVPELPPALRLLGSYTLMKMALVRARPQYRERPNPYPGLPSAAGLSQGLCDSLDRIFC